MDQRSRTILAAICAILAGGLSTIPAAAHHGGTKANETRQWPRNLQCVPYAREMSGVQIYGDAHTWWKQARGKYARGSEPHTGAVMAFKPHGNSRLGHVAYVSKIVDSRNILISHSNWSLINGRRGQIERNVPVMDVSPNNDWSEVRVWYHQTQALGGTHWPLHGFIYNAKPGAAPKAQKRRAPILASNSARERTEPVRLASSKEFTKAFADADNWLPSKKFQQAFGPAFNAQK